MLPNPQQLSDLDALRRDVAVWRPALDAIFRRHGLELAAVASYSAGSLPVLSSGQDHVVKLYPPDAALDYDVERAVLARLAGRVPVPALVAHGTLEGWRYVVLQQLEGRPIEELLPAMDEGARHAALRELGALVRALHQTPADGLSSHVPDYARFIGARARELPDAKGVAELPTPFRDSASSFVRDTAPRVAPDVLLHTELGPGHVLATLRDGGLQISGMIDFVEVMRGDPEYDFAAVAFFITRGDGSALASFLDGYGYPPASRGGELARRLTRLLILHRFAPLPWLFRLRPPPPGCDSWPALATHWMGVA